MANPWIKINNFEDLNFLCCLECSYKCKEELSIQSHALSEHPWSDVFFMPSEETFDENIEGMYLNSKQFK